MCALKMKVANFSGPQTGNVLERSKTDNRRYRDCSYFFLGL